jgi:uncharacterized membrane protein
VETRSRSIVKSLTWRAGGLLVTVCVAWVLIGRADVAASIGLFDTGVKLVAFYAHERLWLKVRFGRLQTDQYEI